MNADDFRSVLVGNYEVYALMTGAIDGKFVEEKMRFDAARKHEAAQDAQEIRNHVQKELKEKRCNFLADSMDCPAFVIKQMMHDAGYSPKVFYLEVGVPSKALDTFAEKTALARKRMTQRCEEGGHGHPFLLPPANDDFVRKYRKLNHACAVELASSGIPVQFYISEGNAFLHVGELKDFPAVELTRSDGVSQAFVEAAVILFGCQLASKFLSVKSHSTGLWNLQIATGIFCL